MTNCKSQGEDVIDFSLYIHSPDEFALPGHDPILETHMADGFEFHAAQRSDTITKGIFNNAINAIKMGVEDFLSATQNNDSRFASSARNLCAGTVLLLMSYLAAKSHKRGYELIRSINKIKSHRKNIDKDPTLWPSILAEDTAGYGTLISRVQRLCLEEKKLDDKLRGIHKFRCHIEHIFDHEILLDYKKTRLIRNAIEMICDFMHYPLQLNVEDYFDDKVCNCLLGFRQKPEILINQEANLDLLDWDDYDVCEAIKELFICPECGCDVCDVVNPQQNVKAEEATYRCSDNAEHKFSFQQVIEILANRCECNVCGETIMPEEFETYLKSRMCGYHTNLWEKEDLLG